MRLNLSQHLLVGNRYSISMPGETEDYFGDCSLEGETEHHCDSWFALTEKAKEVWLGETKIGEGGITLGRLKYSPKF